MKDDFYFMNRCEDLADKAAEKGNPAVGAIIVKDGEIISEAEEAGRSKNDITCHAEIEAIREALKKLPDNNFQNCIMYTTHEPCIMCSYAIRFYKIPKIIFRNKVQFLGGVSSSMPLLLSKEVPAHWALPPEVVYLNNFK